METLLAKPKLRLNKKVISRLQTFRSRGNNVVLGTDVFCGTRDCTYPECGSIMWNCKTDNLQSCAPCVPSKDPMPSTKGC